MRGSGFTWLRSMLLGPALAALCAASAGAAAVPDTRAASRDRLDALADPRASIRLAALKAIVSAAEPASLAVVDAYRQGQLGRYRGHLVVVTRTYQNADFESFSALAHPITGIPYRKDAPSAQIVSLAPSPNEYGLISMARALEGLADPDAGRRVEAVETLSQVGDLSTLPVLDARLAGESDAKVRRAMQEGAALITLRCAAGLPRDQVLGAAARLATSADEASLGPLDLISSGSDPVLAAAAARAALSIRTRLKVGRWVEYLFSGLSLASILVLMALGLSVVFGLMGVINMAHGELMMIGAFTTFLVEHAFERWVPSGWFNFYYVLAVPAAFLASAAAGWLIELLVVRHLYGRPLETLLATWGGSLILIQGARVAFGDNVAVNSPTWFQGSVEIAEGVALSANRCFIISLTALCVALLTMVMRRTRLGLLIRATTQNRAMAAALGVHVRKIDAVTFALGAGLAGIAGCALTLVNGISPDMGQNYIVDSFLVVVTGGVGKLAGAVVAGLGLGTFTKLLEPVVEATWANVWMLILVVALIHWRPSGLFPAQGRSADADR